MKRALLHVAVCAIALLAASPVLAGSYYLGAGIGNTFFESDFEVVEDNIKKIDENSTAWKIFGGWRNHKFLGIEGGYRDFGKVETTVENKNYSAKTTGWDVEALGKLDIAIVQIFAKAGVMFWNTDFAGGDDSGTDFLWGLGAGVTLGPIGVRLEWEVLELSEPDNLSTVSLGATWGF